MDNMDTDYALRLRAHAEAVPISPSRPAYYAIRLAACQAEGDTGGAEFCARKLEQAVYFDTPQEAK